MQLTLNDAEKNTYMYTNTRTHTHIYMNLGKGYTSLLYWFLNFPISSCIFQKKCLGKCDVYGN